MLPFMQVAELVIFILRIPEETKQGSESSPSDTFKKKVSQNIKLFITSKNASI